MRTRGKSLCWVCREALIFDNSRITVSEIMRLAPRATGRDGRCTGCRAYERTYLAIRRWEDKQDKASYPTAWVPNQVVDLIEWWEIANGPQADKPAARWRAKTRNSKHR